MNYIKHYMLLMKKATNRILPENVYFERHHFLPESLEENEYAKEVLLKCGIENQLIKLKPEEHFVAHLLLLKIFKDNSFCYEKMLYAATFLRSRVRNNKEYGWLRKRFSKMMSEILTGKPSRALGCKWSEERKIKGAIHLKGKTYEEIMGEKKAKKLREKKSQKTKGKKLEERIGEERANVIKEKLSKVKRSEEWNKKNSEARKGQKLTEETKLKIKQFMSNDLLNKNVQQEKYRFKNTRTNEVVFCRKIDMKKQYGCSNISSLFNGKRQDVKGWILENEN